MNDRVKELMEMGYNVRTAYRMVAHAKADNVKEATKFDYDKETPKGEWV